MAHQLKVERSKSCGQLFPLSEKNFLRFRTPSATKGEGGGNVPREDVHTSLSELGVSETHFCPRTNATPVNYRQVVNSR